MVDDKSTVAVHRRVDFSIMVVIDFSFLFPQIAEKPLARMTVTGRMKARTVESSSLRDYPFARPWL